MSSDKWNDIRDRNHVQQPRNNDAEDDEFGEFEGFEAARQFYAEHGDPQQEQNGAGAVAVPPWGHYPDYVPEQHPRPGALQPDLLPTRAPLHASCPMTDSGGSVGEAEATGNQSDRAVNGGGIRDEPINRRGPLPDVSSGSDTRRPPVQPDVSDGEARHGHCRQSAPAPIATLPVANGLVFADPARNPAEEVDPRSGHRRLARRVDSLHDQVALLAQQMGELRQSEDSWRQRDARHRELQQQLARLEQRHPLEEDGGALPFLTEERLQTIFRENIEQQRAMLNESLARFGTEVVRMVETSVKALLVRGESGGCVAGAAHADATSALVRDALREFAEEQRQREALRSRQLSESLDAVLAGTRQQLAKLLRPDT